MMNLALPNRKSILLLARPVVPSRRRKIPLSARKISTSSPTRLTDRACLRIGAQAKVLSAHASVFSGEEAAFSDSVWLQVKNRGTCTDGPRLARLRRHRYSRVQPSTESTLGHRYSRVQPSTESTLGRLFAYIKPLNTIPLYSVAEEDNPQSQHPVPLQFSSSFDAIPTPGTPFVLSALDAFALANRRVEPLFPPKTLALPSSFRLPTPLPPCPRPPLTDPSHCVGRSPLAVSSTIARLRLAAQSAKLQDPLESSQDRWGSVAALSVEHAGISFFSNSGDIGATVAAAVLPCVYLVETIGPVAVEDAARAAWGLPSSAGIIPPCLITPLVKKPQVISTIYSLLDALDHAMGTDPAMGTDSGQHWCKVTVPGVAPDIVSALFDAIGVPVVTAFRLSVGPWRLSNMAALLNTRGGVVEVEVPWQDIALHAFAWRPDAVREYSPQLYQRLELVGMVDPLSFDFIPPIF